MFKKEDIIHSGYKYGFRKGSIINLLDYYHRKGYTFETIVKCIIEDDDYNIIYLLFLNMGHINPIISGKRYIDKTNEYKDDYSAVKILELLKKGI